MKRIICLSPCDRKTWAKMEQYFQGAELIRAETIEALRAQANKDAVLFSFGSGLIVPTSILEQYGLALNLHAASPDFPGRDPHHHAVYASVGRYGATLHHMVASVDAGPIVDVAYFDVPQDTTPAELLHLANAAGLELAQRYGPDIVAGRSLPVSNEKWGTQKFTRKDLQQQAHLSRFIGPEELGKRFRAFDGGSHNNLTTKIFDHDFRIEKPSQRASGHTEDWSGFTEDGFRAILATLCDRGYVFADYHNRPDKPHVIWRHDVDFSLQRALWCARAEAEAGAIGTYFINPRCAFYNILEPESLRCIAEIADLGHAIGLHFDAGALGIKEWSLPQLETALSREADMFHALCGRRPNSVSWHNPDLSNLLDFDGEHIAGLANAYARSLREDYTYCSDSNGYWRFTPMPDVITEGHARMHLLTHPAWWTPTSLPPRARIERAIAGRANALSMEYDALLIKGGRTNKRD